MPDPLTQALLDHAWRQNVVAILWAIALVAAGLLIVLKAKS